MTNASFSLKGDTSAVSSVTSGTFTTVTSRTVLLAVVTVSIICSFDFASSDAAASAGPELTRLMRFMAALKAGLAAAGLGLLFWRLALPVTPMRLAAYVIASTAMTAGPGLIWEMNHVGLGAVLLHGGLIGLAVLLWRDPATAARLNGLVERERASGRVRPVPTSEV